MRRRAEQQQLRRADPQRVAHRLRRLPPQERLQHRIQASRARRSTVAAIRCAAARSRGARPPGSASSASSSGRRRSSTASSSASAARRAGDGRRREGLAEWARRHGAAGVYGPLAPHVLVRRRMHLAPLASPERPPLGTALDAAQRRPRTGPRAAMPAACSCRASSRSRPPTATRPASPRPAGRWWRAATMSASASARRSATRSPPASTGCRPPPSTCAGGDRASATASDIWAYRVPSLAGAILAVLATFHWGRALVGRRAAFLGAAMLASSLVLVVEAHIAKTDAALLATTTAAMGLFGTRLSAAGRLHRAAGGGVLAGARRRRAAEGADRADGAAAGRRSPWPWPTAAPRPGCGRSDRSGAWR